MDTIGVPVFGAVKGNATFIPEMDGDFRITEFTEFYNEHGFAISYDLPAAFRDTVFAVQSSAPIPFWIDNACHVIPGDADKNEPEKLFGSRAAENPVLKDIARLLDDARSGRIEERMQEWASQNISNAFADVFYEEPSRSRYWVSRYRVAVAHARKKTQPPHPIDSRLRTVAGDWLVRFGSKTDLPLLGGLLGNSENQIFTRRQMTDILFAFFVSRLALNDPKIVDMYAEEPALHKAFPKGLYHHYLEHGWPRVPFHYPQVSDFAFRMMNTLSECRVSGDWRPATRLALLLFGRAKLPDQVDSLARSSLKDTQQEFSRLRRDSRDIFRSRSLMSSWGYTARALLELYDQLMDLDGIINGPERMKREPYDKRFGVPLEFLKDLKKIRKNEW